MGGPWVAKAWEVQSTYMIDRQSFCVKYLVEDIYFKTIFSSEYPQWILSKLEEVRESHNQW